MLWIANATLNLVGTKALLRTRLRLWQTFQIRGFPFEFQMCPRLWRTRRQCLNTWGDPAFALLGDNQHGCFPRSALHLPVYPITWCNWTGTSPPPLGVLWAGTLFGFIPGSRVSADPAMGCQQRLGWEIIEPRKSNTVWIYKFIK